MLICLHLCERENEEQRPPCVVLCWQGSLPPAPLHLTGKLTTMISAQKSHLAMSDIAHRESVKQIDRLRYQIAKTLDTIQWVDYTSGSPNFFVKIYIKQRSPCVVLWRQGLLPSAPLHLTGKWTTMISAQKSHLAMSDIAHCESVLQIDGLRDLEAIQWFHYK